MVSYDVAAMQRADTALASDCRTQFGRPSTRRGCRICLTVRLPVRPHGGTMHWQANAKTLHSATPLLNVPNNLPIVSLQGVKDRGSPTSAPLAHRAGVSVAEHGYGAKDPQLREENAVWENAFLNVLWAQTCLLACRGSFKRYPEIGDRPTKKVRLNLPNFF